MLEVDDDLAGSDVLEHPVVPEHDGLDDGAVGQRQQDDLASLDHGRDRRRRCAPPWPRPCPGLMS